jgi:hypothetical protein
MLTILKRKKKELTAEANKTLPVNFNYFELKAIYDVFSKAGALADIARHDRLMIAEINYKLNKAGFYK